MTIDKRLEALTQSLELIAHMQQAEEKRAAERDAKTDQRISRILDVVEKQAGNIDKLAAIAHDHQQRIERLES
jgi:enoyl-[acyl-carrier-protein] reductase (NADH)